MATGGRVVIRRRGDNEVVAHNDEVTKSTAGRADGRWRVVGLGCT
ncbi:1-deoxy-D-xylulose-5-phosphate reductoisomerase, partial [Staphylococcus condimenti]